jgi:hypothetical protein
MTPYQKILMAGAICAAAQLRVIPSHAADAPGAMPGDAVQFAGTGQQIAERGQARVAATAPTVAEDKPLTDMAHAQAQRVVDKGTAMQSNARVQCLMQLAQEKNCH